MPMQEATRLFNVQMNQRPIDSKWDVVLSCPEGVRFARYGLETEQDAIIAQIEGLSVACEILEAMCVFASESHARIRDLKEVN